MLPLHGVDTSAQKEEYHQKITSEVAARDDFLKKRKKYLEDKNANPDGKNKREKRSSTLDSVEATKSTEFAAHKYLGWLWPTPIFTEKKGRPPNKKEKISMVINGSKIWGVVLDEPGPPGCIQLWNKTASGVKRTASIGDSDNSTMSELAVAFTEASSKARVSTKPIKGTDALKPIAKALAAGDSESDDAILDEVWGPRGVAAASSEEEDEGAPEKNNKKIKKPSGKRRNNKQPPSNAGEPENERRAVSKNKTREIETSESVNLKCSQLLAALNDPVQFASATVGNFESLVAKVNSRLTPELVAVYTQGYVEGGPADRGVQCLEALRDHQRKLPKLAGLVRSLAATEGDLATAEALSSQIQAAQAAGTPLAPGMQNLVLERAIQELSLVPGGYEQVLEANFNT